MPNNKKNLMDKKVPYNLSIRNGLSTRFEQVINYLKLDRNALFESFMNDFLIATKDYDKTN